MSTPNVLIVDDEKKHPSHPFLDPGMLLTLPRTPPQVGTEALQKLTEKSFQLMLLDLKLPDMDGLEVLRLVSDKYPDLKVIIMTAYGSIETAVEAMKTGALDFLQKPLEPNVVHNVVNLVLPESFGRSTGLEI